MGDSGRHRTPKTCPHGHIFGVPEGGEEGGRHRTLKTRPCRDVCGVQHKRKGRERVEHHKCASVGTFVVFDTRGMCQTPKTCPQGHVRGVRHEGNGRECAEHQKHAHKGMFVAFDTRGRGVGKGGAVSGVVEGEGKGGRG